MGHRVNRIRATQDLDGDTDGHESRTVLSAPSAIPLSGVPEDHHLALLLEPGTDVMAKLLLPIPPLARSRVLVDFYVSHAMESDVFSRTRL